MKKELEDKILKIAQEIEDCEEQFDNAESGYYFQRIKQKLYGIKMDKRFNDVKNLFEQVPFGYNNRLKFRDGDFQFWQEEVKPDISHLGITVSEMLGKEKEDGETDEVITNKKVIVIHDCDVCRDDDNLVIIYYPNKMCLPLEKIIVVALSDKELKLFRENNFKMGYQDSRDKFHVMKYEPSLNEVVDAFATERKINSALFWIDSMIDYLKNGD